jgi:hypothetical protein
MKQARRFMAAPEFGIPELKRCSVANGVSPRSDL